MMFAMGPSGMFEAWFCQPRGSVLIVARSVLVGGATRMPHIRKAVGDRGFVAGFWDEVLTVRGRGRQRCRASDQRRRARHRGADHGAFPSFAPERREPL